MNKRFIKVINEDSAINIIAKELGISKKTGKKYLKNNMVTLNNNLINFPNTKVFPEDTITINYTHNTLNYNLDILYEDNYLIAINKPAGLLSISNNSEKYNTAYHLVSDYVKRNDKKYIFVVHRIDQDTSGVLLFAKDKNTRDKLQSSWNESVKLREYIALVNGILTGKKTIKSYLTENHTQIIHSTNSHQGKLAITHYEVLKTNNNFSLLKVNIDTGRRNQIRVHLSELGHPIVGDKKYHSQTNPIKRLCLHASTLSLIHPITHKLITISAPYPVIFDTLLTRPYNY